MSSSSRAPSPEDIPKYNTQFEPGSDDDETLWSVLQIVKESRDRYLVKWAGVDPDTGKPWDMSWVPKHDCTDDLIHEWKVSKSKKVQDRKKEKKKRKLKGNASYSDTTSASRHGKSATSRNKSGSVLSSVAGSSRSLEETSCDKTTRGIGIVSPRKRRREYHSSDDGNSVEYVTDDVIESKKKRSRVMNKRDATSPSSYFNDRADSSHKLRQSLSRPGSSQDQNELDSDASNNPFRIHTHSLKRQHPEIKPHGETSDGEERHDGPDAEPGFSGNSSSSRIQPLRALSQYSFEIAHDDMEQVNIDDKGDENVNLDGMIHKVLDADILSHQALSPLPSPRDLIMGTDEGTDAIIPETQSSVSISQLSPRVPASTNHSPPQPDRDREPKVSRKIIKDSEIGINSHKMNPDQRLRPIPAMSPKEFEAHVSSARAARPNSQVSAIETFTSPNKSQPTAERISNSHEGELVDSQGMRASSYSPRQSNGSDVHDEHASVSHDPIEGFEAPLSDQALQIRGAKPAEAARVQRSTVGPPELVRRPLGDILSVPGSPAVDGTVSPVDGERDMRVKDEAKSDQTDDGQLESQHNKDAANGVDDMGEDLRNMDQGEVDDLRPEDAPDARESVGPSRPTNLISSGNDNYSIEVNAALTQQSASRPPAIPLHVRELDHALGLLNRKSEEIELLTVSLNNYQSRVAELDKEVLGLKHDMALSEKRYEEVNEELNKERTSKVPEEERVEDDSGAKSLATSSLAYADRFVELLQENEQLKHAKVQMESDTDMLRNLYTRASDAHQARVVEIKTLKQENDSLREQATTGVKQAQMFWSTQVQKLEAELARSKGTIELLTEQSRRTDNDVRTRAALLPMAQQETDAAKKKCEDLRVKFMDLGSENTRLRLQVKRWEEEAIIRQKEQELKAQETALEDELVWMCSWRDTKHGGRCGALLESREKLREHLYQAGHI